MTLTSSKINKVIVVVWIIATLFVAFFITDLGGTPQVLFGLPWIIVLAIICQLSILGLFVFIAKRIWIIDEEGSK